MNKLQLVQRLAREAGMARQPDSTVAQVGEFGRVCDWIDSALLKIEGDEERRWSWMWERTTLTVPAGTAEVAGELAATRYVLDSMCDMTDGGEFPPYLDYLPWYHFVRTYPRIASGPTSTFGVWSVRPDNALVFNGVPATDRIVQVERYREPRTIEGDASTPPLPKDLHLLIVWTALVYYASFDEAGAQRATAREEETKLFSSLVARCTDPLTLGAPLV